MHSLLIIICFSLASSIKNYGYPSTFKLICRFTSATAISFGCLFGSCTSASSEPEGMIYLYVHTLQFFYMHMFASVTAKVKLEVAFGPQRNKAETIVIGIFGNEAPVASKMFLLVCRFVIIVFYKIISESAFDFTFYEVAQMKLASLTMAVKSRKLLKISELTLGSLL